MKKTSYFKFFVASFFVLISLNFIIFSVAYLISKQETPTGEPEYPELPQLYINLNDTTLSEINSGSKDVRYKNNDLTFYIDGEYYDFSNVEIKGRGNSTWTMSNKKPYQIKFESKENLFGLGKAKSWVLLANYFDNTLVRNDIAFYVARLLDLEYSNDGQFVEVYFDDEYEGLYYLTQKVGISQASVNIKDELGVLMELDNIYSFDEDKQYRTIHEDVFVLKDSVTDDEDKKNIAISSFMKDYSNFEKAVEEKNWERINELVDVDSFARFYILQDFSLNWDSFATSMFFYKDGPNDKIHAGPAWDFDNAYGRWLETMFYRRDIEYNGLEDKVQSDTFFDLMKIKEFKELVSSYNKKIIIPNSENILSRLDMMSKYISNAAQRDHEKWELEDYFGEVEKVRNTIKKRLDYYSIFYANEENLTDGYYLLKNIDTEFLIEAVKDGGYKITRTSDGKALTVDESYNEYGTISFHSYKDSIWQNWYICRDNEGGYYLFSVATESVLALDQDGNLITKPLSRSENENFEIVEIGAFPLDTFTTKN